jgi:hypothetical protein
MTAADAARLGLSDRGRIEVGQQGDTALFDPAAFRDTATFGDPCRYPVGLAADIPTGLVPLSALGEALGVATPLMRAVVDLGSTLLGRDFWREGRSLARLGLAGKGAEEIRRLILE